MKYSDQLKDPRWLIKRLSILIRDKYTCQICGYIGRNINVHHKKYSGMAWNASNEDLISICSHCHRIIHKPDKVEKRDDSMKIGNIIKKINHG